MQEDEHMLTGARNASVKPLLTTRVKPTNPLSYSIKQQTGRKINRWHCFPGLGPQPQLEPLQISLSFLSLSFLSLPGAYSCSV